MAADNVELVRRFYDALNANDLAGLGALCDEIEYVNPDVAAEPRRAASPSSAGTATARSCAFACSAT